MHTRDSLVPETKEILRAVTTFKALHYEQVRRLLYGREMLAERLIKNLCKQHRIYYDTASGLIADCTQSAENPSMALINAFWVFLEFNDRAEYYDIGEHPVLISFFANQEHYEILHAAYGNEVAFNYMLSKSADSAKGLLLLTATSKSGTCMCRIYCVFARFRPMVA